MNIAGGSSGASLNPQASLVPPLAAPALPGAPAGAPRIGLFAIPGTAGSESAGSMRYLFERVWGVPYAEVSAEQIKAGLSGIDVLLVPDGYAKGGLQALGTKGQKALLAWVEGGGRYVGYRGGTELAVGAGLSTAVLQATHTAAPGTLIRVALDPASPLAAGIPKATESTPTAWLMYDNDDLMSLGLGSTVARFPARGEPAFHTSGLAIGVDELAGIAAIGDEPVGNGQSAGRRHRHRQQGRQGAARHRQGDPHRRAGGRRRHHPRAAAKLRRRVQGAAQDRTHGIRDRQPRSPVAGRTPLRAGSGPRPDAADHADFIQHALTTVPNGSYLRLDRYATTASMFCSPSTVTAAVIGG